MTMILLLHVLIALLFAQCRVHTADLWPPPPPPPVRPDPFVGDRFYDAGPPTWGLHERLKQLNKRFNVTFGGILRDFDAMGRAAGLRMMDYVVGDHRGHAAERSDRLGDEKNPIVGYGKRAIDGGGETESAATTDVWTVKSVGDEGLGRLLRRQWPVTKIKYVDINNNVIFAVNKIKNAVNKFNNIIRSHKTFKVVNSTEDEKTLRVILHDKANASTRIKTNSKCQNAHLRHQEPLARIPMDVLAGNLNKTARTMSTIPSISDTHFVPDNRMMKIKKFISYLPSFRIHEMFCLNCAPHSLSSYCVKCQMNSRHQLKMNEMQNPVIFPKIIDNSRQKDRTPNFWYYLIALLFLMACLIFVLYFIFCCRGKNKSAILNVEVEIANAIKKKLKNETDYRLLSDDTKDKRNSNKQWAFRDQKLPEKYNKLQHKLKDGIVNFCVPNERTMKDKHYLMVSEMDDNKRNCV